MPSTNFNISTGDVCAGETVPLSAPDLGYPCLEYAWNFGQNASPQCGIGQGPFLVTYSVSGVANVELTIDNVCISSSNLVSEEEEDDFYFTVNKNGQTTNLNWPSLHLI